MNLTVSPVQPIKKSPLGERLTGCDIVCISSIDWDFIWQGHQEIMATLAAQGNRVLFIENTGIRSVNLSDIPRLHKRLVSWWKSVRGFRQERANLYVYSPLGLPFPYSRIAQTINRFLITMDLRRFMRVVQLNHPIVWTFLPTPLVMDIIQGLDPQLVIYYCIDNFAASSPAARKIRRAEPKMIQSADLVFVTSQQLFEHVRPFNPNVHLFPFGVNMEQFEKVRNALSDKTPQDIAVIPHPRIGYVGGIHKWVDIHLIREVARRFPAFHFVLVGPLQMDVSSLKGTPNIHFLGEKSHELIPYYVRAFDVGMIPYRLTEYTDNVYPTKTNEYLAAGRPVVSTPLREVLHFNQRHGALIAIGSTAEEFGQRIKEILEHKVEDEDTRIAVARENSWHVKIKEMEELISQKLRERQARKGIGWQELFRTVYVQTRRRAVSVLLAVGIVAGIVFYTPLPWFMAAPLHQADSPIRAEAIVVFGGGVGESGKAGQGYEERVEKAVELYRAGYAPRVIFSSGYIHVFQEAEVMKALALLQGIPQDAILLEEHARNTYENVRNVSRICALNQWNSILLVSSPYHMRRARMVFAKSVPTLRIIATPVERSYFYFRSHPGMSLEQFKGVMHEYLSIVYYWMKGWV